MRAVSVLLPFALAPVCGLTACSAPTRLYFNPQADMAYYRRVAVIPFVNLSDERFAGDRVTRAFVTELLIFDRFRVVEPTEVVDRLIKLRAEPDVQGRVDPEKLKLALEGLDANGFIRGAVTEYQMRRAGQDDYPVVTFDVEMVDTATQTVVWRVSVSKKGRGRFAALAGSSLRTFGSVTQEACAAAVARLRSAF